MIHPIENCIYAIKARMSDISQVLSPADILGTLKAISGRPIEKSVSEECLFFSSLIQQYQLRAA